MSRQPTSSAKYVDHDHSYFSASVGPNKRLVDVVPNEDMHGEEETGNGIIIRLPLSAFQLVMFIYSSCVTNFVYIFLLFCQRKFNLILILRTQVCSLRDENAKLKKRIECLQKKEDLCKCKLPIFEQLLKSDSDVNFIQVFQQFQLFQLSNIYRNLFHHMLGIDGG